MSEFLYEVKKILLYQKGLFYITITLLFGTVWLVASDSPYDSAMEQYKNEYEWYLEKVTGYCTKEYSLYLEREAEKMTEAKKKQRYLLESYYDGNIKEREYKEESEKIDKALEHQHGFEVMYQQYLYICEHPENRYFLQTNGWMGLLGRNTFPFILFLGILLLGTPVFCSEYSCQMDVLIITSKEGQKSSLSKLFLAIANVLFLCGSISLIEYGFYSIKYGLPDGDYPIQSLPYFADSSKDISLFEGYIWIGLLRLFGSVFLTIFLMLLSILTKKYPITLLAGAASVLLPYIGLSKTHIYRLPLPLPFLLGTDFFAGDIISIDALTGDKKIVFAEVDTVTLLILLLLSILLCTLASVWILRCHSNKWQIKSKKKRTAAALAIILILIPAMAGCSGSREKQSFVYNSSADYDCMGYDIIQDTATSDYYLTNAATGETIPFVRSPMFGAFSDEEKVRCYCVCSPYLYYTTFVTESYVNRVGNYNSSITKVAVTELNLNTFEEKIIFEQITNSGRSLFGIDYETGNKWKFLEFHYAFFLNSDYIFFISNDGITQINRSTRSLVKLDIPTNGTISFDGESIFYKNEQAVLTRYHVSSGKTTVYEHTAVYDFCIDEQSIYYVSRTDGGCVYSCDKDGSNKKRIQDIPALSVTCDINNIYISVKESGKELVLKKTHQDLKP